MNINVACLYASAGAKPHSFLSRSRLKEARFACRVDIALVYPTTWCKEERRRALGSTEARYPFVR